MRPAYAIHDLRAAAQRRLPRAIFDFFDGGAEDEITLEANRSAFQRQRFLPRVLKDVSHIDTRTELFGESSSMPMAIAPTGANRTRAGDDGDFAFETEHEGFLLSFAAQSIPRLSRRVHPCPEFQQKTTSLLET
jgi:isopentenyl diphosphate isomerase/L-lactate dehydrogenase-like FMN-dependent dehydrogenase